MFEGAKANLAKYREAEYRDVLQPGERILATGLVQRAFIGQDDIATAPDQVDEVVAGALAAVENLPPLPRGFTAVAWAASAAVDPFRWNPDPSRLLGGRIGQGAAGSVASLFSTALKATMTDLVVTDQRLAIARDTDREVPVEGGGIPATAKELPVAVPRQVVYGVRRRRRPLEWGRLELAFTDGSWITLTAGMISGRRANRFLRALTTPM